jgi:hypothetical protein
MKDGTPTILYTKETREYARHVRYWRDVRDSRVSLFSCLSRINHVTRVCATSGERQGQRPFAHVKRVTLQVITLSPSWLASSRRYVIYRGGPRNFQQASCDGSSTCNCLPTSRGNHRSNFPFSKRNADSLYQLLESKSTTPMPSGRPVRSLQLVQRLAHSL